VSRNRTPDGFVRSELERPRASRDEMTALASVARRLHFMAP
jgi:hypothetical protein